MSTLPSRSNGYAIAPDTRASTAFFQAIFADVHQRLSGLELTEADYDAAIAAITTQALAIVSANITAEVDAQRANLAAIQELLNDLLAEYESVQAGGVPATSIAVTAIAGLAGANVQAVLLSIKGALDAKAANADLTALGTRVSKIETARSPFTFAYAFR